MKANKTKMFLNKTVKRLCREFDLTATVIESTHFKVYFQNKFGEKCMFVLSKTSSNRNVRRVEIALIRRELKSKLDTIVSNDFFTMQYQF